MQQAGDIDNRQHIPGESFVEPDQTAARKLTTPDAYGATIL
jgi:hypothetical protein